jgi:hypothetical protein
VAEQGSHKPRVGGSSPPAATIYIRQLSTDHRVSVLSLAGCSKRPICGVGAFGRTLDVQTVRLACGHRAPPWGDGYVQERIRCAPTETNYSRGGILTENSVPTPSRLTSAILPPIASTSTFTPARPRPSPGAERFSSALSWTKRSKTDL